MLKGKRVIITGASRGIGKEMAAAFAEVGASLMLTHNSSPIDGTVTLVKERAADGVQVATFKGDVSDPAMAAEAVKQCVEQLGGVDVLINNAGITRDGLLMRMKEADWDDVMNTNLKGSFNMLKAVTRGMMKQRSGRIINLGSVVGSMGNAGQVNYSASKAGLIGLTKAAARELASRNINVNLIAPGFIVTDMTEAMDEKAKDALLGGIPMARLGSVKDVADAAIFLSSDMSAYITGQVLHVNGGMYM